MPLTPEMQELAAHVSNRGRWGTDDQRGTLNLITPEATRRGVLATRTGKTFSLTIPFDGNGPQWDSVNMPHRTNPVLDVHTVNVSFTGDTRDFTTSDDSFSMGSQAATHWDSLAHAGYEGTLYNDTPSSVVTEHGTSRLGMEHFGPIATRGLVIDIARLHGVDYFDDAYAITGDDLDRACAAGNVTAEPGDVLLVRTGQMHYLRAGDKPRYSAPAPGLSTVSIPWLRDHDIAAVATDSMTFEVYPCENPRVFMPVHMIHLRDMGLVQGQNWDLDALAADSAADGAYECLLVATPLPLTGAVGAPVAPTAIK